MSNRFYIFAIPVMAALILLPIGITHAQLIIPEDPSDQSTVVYTADYFAEYRPVSANDMLNRIPGIGLALRGGGGGRGLGSGEGEVLINGQRITGKSNEGRNQLNRISADQVDYIEIIRGTSEELDIRGGGQVVNVVLLDLPSRSNTTVELEAKQLRDGTTDPGGQASISGQSGDFNYVFNVGADPRYRASEAREFSYDPDSNLIEHRREERTRDETQYQISTNLGYQLEKSVIQLNALYEDRGNTPSDTYREIHDLEDAELQIQSEDNNSEQTNWEIGGDYEYAFNNGGKFRFLFIVNDREFQFTRNRFDVENTAEEPNLFLDNYGRDRERIARTSYTWNIDDAQGVELGIEGAETIRDSDLRMGLDIAGTPSPSYGNLVPVAIDNSGSSVEEMRYETFAVHNWQINTRMALESSVIVETSTIEQSGDVSNKRDFNFVRPKFDYRFDITPTLQLRAGIEKDVSQLSFSDFSASVDGGDEDQNTQSGNPEIKQEQSWRYELNLEQRLPNDIGVVNAQFWYRDVEDHIDKVDVSTSPDDLRSARGNIGDGKRYGLNLDISTKLGMLGLPNALLTTGIRLRDSEFTDPFLGIKRRQRNNGRWQGNMGFRHDITEYGLAYGLNYSNSSNGSTGRKEFDIIDIEERKESPYLSAYLEKKAFGNLTFRFESRNITDSEFCRTRIRFVGATADGIVEEIEDYCNGNGMELAFRLRTTF
ncbi:MAG: TonB-dependent receptor [Gammaproteobacteria bacterium]|nr:TonB-dependent receptor [Gammaproteobacteria bacterium]MDP6732902.1 TonB-dependent receptor [Gammaproteobacteria bacterium]